MKKRAEELVGRMSQLVEPAEDWHEVGTQDEPLFNSGFSNTSNRETAAFRKAGEFLYIKGRIDHSSDLNGVDIFTLPQDFRPNITVNVPCAVFDGSVWKGGILGIDSSGAVAVVGSGTLTSATLNTNFYLDN